ncbi:MAG: GTPase RsgA, partial [Acidimicrobiales bacterium]
VGDVRADGRGRHTTSSRQLVPVPSGGSLVDMPGLRTLATDASDAAVATAFADVDELAGRCRFADCAHENEPDCAVLAAVAAGTLDPERLASYRRLTDEIVSGPRRSRQRPRAGDTQTTSGRGGTGRSGPGPQVPDEGES